MIAVTKGSGFRSPIMGAFRAAFDRRDAKVRIDERDENGDRVIAGRRAAGRFAVTEADLQRAVSRDIEVLMNTVNLAASIDLHDQPEVGRSILNFGFPDVVHRTIDEITVDDIRHEIAAALVTFEPRLLPGSIDVKRDTGIDKLELKIRFVVRADLNCDPLNVPVEFTADLERDTGKIVIGRS